MEEGAEELMDSDLMRSYLAAEALMGNKDQQSAMAAITELPLEKRYVWRVASALKWAFADFDNLCVEIDRDTLSADDHEKLMKLLKHRPIQFCMFLKALLGAGEMQRMMVQATKVARQVPWPRCFLGGTTRLDHMDARPCWQWDEEDICALITKSVCEG